MEAGGIGSRECTNDIVCFVGTVLATDMSWHFEWVENFGRAMKERRVVNQLSRSNSGSSPNALSGNTAAGQRGIPIEERRGSAIRISDLNEQERKSRHASATELVVKGKDKGSWGEY